MPDPINRYSPLYCAYNGLMLGQFLGVAMARFAEEDYPFHRARVNEFLAESGVEARLPEEQLSFGDPEHLELIQAILLSEPFPKQLQEFALLGLDMILSAHKSVPESALMRAEVERLSAQRGVPSEALAAFLTAVDELPETPRIDDVLSPSLALLEATVATLEVEPHTAFVVMPFHQPYAGRFAPFYRAGLEAVGYRAFRAWGGLSWENYCGLLIQLIGKSGLVLAELSEHSSNVFYEVGVAHALGKTTMLIVDQDFTGKTPSNIGHDAVIKYDPADEDWPESGVASLGMMLSAVLLAAEQRDRLRVGGDDVGAALERAAELLKDAMAPEDGYTHFLRGVAHERDGEYAAAQADFSAAIEHGHDDADVRQRRAFVRIRLGELDEAAADLDAIPGDDHEAATAARRADLMQAGGDYLGASVLYAQALEADQTAERQLDLALSMALAGELAGAKKLFKQGAAAADALDLERTVREIAFWSERDQQLPAAARNALAAMRQSLRKRLG